MATITASSGAAADVPTASDVAAHTGVESSTGIPDPCFADVEQFLKRYPCDQKAANMLRKSPPLIVFRAVQEFRPPREGDADYSALLMMFVKGLRRSATCSEDQQLADAGHIANLDHRLRKLVITLFGVAREVGTFPTPLHSDIRHMVEMLRRGKRARLTAERAAAVEVAIASPGSNFKNIAELRSQVDAWRAESQRSWDAAKYYDSNRAAMYTSHNRGPQEILTQRTLQMSSVATEIVTPQAIDASPESLLAIDLGCGSGLSTSVAEKVPGYRLGVIGVDLSGDMLGAKSWAEVKDAMALPGPLSGERLRCDISQPLPFRTGVFDLAYSVGTIHYLVQDSVTRTSQARLGDFMSSLQRCLATGARPCTLQAFVSSDLAAVPKIKAAAAGAGWPVCELVLDRAHGAASAERDFIYIALPPGGREGILERPPCCSMYRRAGATCALALGGWARDCNVPPPLLNGSHHSWLEREHVRFAKRLVRLRQRSALDGAELDHAEAPDGDTAALADRLAEALRNDLTEEEELQRIIGILHGSGAHAASKVLA